MQGIYKTWDIRACTHVGVTYIQFKKCDLVVGNGRKWGTQVKTEVMPSGL